MSASNERPELIYVGDPLCSWCWGFAPSLRKLRLQRPNAFRYRHVVGGLRTGASAQPLDDHLRAYLASAWKEVERRSGQPFRHDFLETATFVYDTEPACRAVVAARTIVPDKELEYNETLQDAFYHRGMDPTKLETFVTVARELGISEDRFEESVESDDVARRTREDFDEARRLGVHGFPTVLVRDGAGIETVAHGWMHPDAFVEQLHPWIGSS